MEQSSRTLFAAVHESAFGQSLAGMSAFGGKADIGNHSNDEGLSWRTVRISNKVRKVQRAPQLTLD
jgi:hypothetical protein